MAGALGIEPSSVVLETIILPMYYAPICKYVNYNNIYFNYMQEYKINFLNKS